MLEQVAGRGREALLRILAASPQINQAFEPGVIQRLLSHSAASSSSSHTAARFSVCHCSSDAGAHTISSSKSSSNTSPLACASQKHQQLAQLHRNSSSVLAQHNPWHPSKAFSSSAATPADDSSSSSSNTGGSFGRKHRRRLGGSAESGQQQQQQDRGWHQQQQQQQGRSAPPPPLAAIQGAMGRRLALCVPTEQLREPEEQYDEFSDRRPEVMRPRQADGTNSPTDDLDVTLLLRQQIENSALPSALKRSQLIAGTSWDELLLNVNRTVKVTKGGKVETLHAMVAVGNADGLIGIGEHSGKNIQKVAMDACLKAYRNLVAIPRYRQHTVFHPMDIKNRKVRMQVWPRMSGFGITASPLITQLCELSGIRDVTIKVTGRRRNKRNVVNTFVEGLLGQSLPHEGVEGTGVYMREVYHARSLPCGLKRGVDVP